jgi:predicted nucleotidyltransferase
MKENQYIKQIVERLKQANPYKIILFGSYAYGLPQTNSDIDILVVTSDNFMPNNYEEKMQITLNISRMISDIKAEHPVDLIVHTLPMYKKFIELGSMFAKEIQTNGKVIYEADHSRVD